MSLSPALSSVVFLQGSPPISSNEPDIGFMVFLIMTGAFVGFFAGLLVMAILNGRKARAGSVQTPYYEPVGAKRINIMHCVQCDSTYTDEDLSYCLRDGTILKVVGTMPAPPDPEATRVIDRSRRY